MLLATEIKKIETIYNIFNKFDLFQILKKNYPRMGKYKLVIRYCELIDPYQSRQSS